MSSRSLTDAQAWVAQGTQLCADCLDSLGDADFAAASNLPGWTRAHVVAHLAANAEALGNLVHWAATGEQTPMYSSPEQRNAEIEDGATRAPAQLREWFTASAAELADDMSALSEDAWQRTVRTAQGRQVPASETPWMRAREVMVHAVDLDAGVRFEDLPESFLAALVEDITAKRGADAVPDVQADLAARARWLAGRGDAGVQTPDGGPAPQLPPWL